MLDFLIFDGQLDTGQMERKGDFWFLVCCSVHIKMKLIVWITIIVPWLVKIIKNNIEKFWFESSHVTPSPSI